MADKINLDNLSIAELERLLAIKRREARQTRLRRMKQAGRVIDTGENTSILEQIDRATTTHTGQSAPVNNGTNAPEIHAATIEAQPGSVKKRKSVPQFEDALDDNRTRRRKNDDEGSAIWRKFLDRSMLVTEALAVIGMIGLAIAMLQGVIILQEETAEAQAAAEAQRRATLPTVQPTPALSLDNIVLPSGHTPPKDGITSFNFEEIPSNLRGKLASEVYLPPDVSRPEPTDNTPLRVVIPAIGVDHTIVQGVDWEALKLGVGQLPNGAMPSATDDNVVLAAHNDIYGEIFKDLDQLEPGMEMQIQTRTQTYTYVIRNQQVVEPDAVHVMQPQGSPMVTLISCYPYRVNNKRIIIHADRI